MIWVNGVLSRLTTAVCCFPLLITLQKTDENPLIIDIVINSAHSFSWPTEIWAALHLPCSAAEFIFAKFVSDFGH